MKHLVVKDRNLRKEFLNEDKKHFLNKFLNRKKITSTGRIKNRCVVTYRGKSVSRFFRHSRLVLRRQALSGLYPGIVKSS
jgi:ribosomal protein S14